MGYGALLVQAKLPERQPAALQSHASESESNKVYIHATSIGFEGTFGCC